MARRKRASMREGPLADLFRSTVPQEGEEEQPTEQQRVPEQPAPEQPPAFRGAHDLLRPRARRSPGPGAAPGPAGAARRPQGSRAGAAGPGARSRLPRRRHSACPRGQGATQPHLRRRRRTTWRAPPTAARSPASGLPRAAASPPADHPRRRCGRSGRERDQPHDRGPGPRGRVHGHQHRPSVAPAVDRRRHGPPRQRRRAGPRHRLQPGARLPGGLQGAGQDQAPAEGLGHGVHHRRRWRRHRHRSRSRDRAARARRRRAHGRDRHQAVPVRGHAPRHPGRPGDRGAERRGRHADRGAQREAPERARSRDHA